MVVVVGRRGGSVVVVVVAWVSGACDRRWLERQTEALEEHCCCVGIEHRAEHLQPTVATWALEHVHEERSAEERRPVDTDRGGIERATEQSVPVFR